MKVGEIIVAIDDELITGLESLLELLSATDPGTEVQIALEDVDTGELRTQPVTLGAHPEGRAGGFIGIMDVTVRAVDADLPFELDIDSGSIGGPSAGLAFALTIIDLLTEGELTGGQGCRHRHDLRRWLGWRCRRCRPKARPRTPVPGFHRADRCHRRGRVDHRTPPNRGVATLDEAIEVLPASVVTSASWRFRSTVSP